MRAIFKKLGIYNKVVTRIWQIASKMKNQRGSLEGDTELSDNNRVKRYVAKYTIISAKELPLTQRYYLF